MSLPKPENTSRSKEVYGYSLPVELCLMHTDWPLFCVQLDCVPQSQGEADLKFSLISVQNKHNAFFPSTLGKLLAQPVVDAELFSVEFLKFIIQRLDIKYESKEIQVQSILKAVYESKLVGFNDNYWLKLKQDNLSFKDISPFYSPNNPSKILKTALLTNLQQYGHVLTQEPDDYLQGPLALGYECFCTWYKEIEQGHCNIYYLKSEQCCNSLYNNLDPENFPERYVFNNEIYGEFFAQQVAKALKLNCVSYEIKGYRCNRQDCQNSEPVLVTLSPLANDENMSFVSFPVFLEALALTQPAYSTQLTREFEQDGATPLLKNEFGKDYLDQCLLDALTFNRDRNELNLAVLKDNESGEYRGMAPIFDNGYAFFALVPNHEIKAHMRKACQGEYTSTWGLRLNRRLICNATDEQVASLESLQNFELENCAALPFAEQRLELINDCFEQNRVKLLSAVKRHLQHS